MQLSYILTSHRNMLKTVWKSDTISDWKFLTFAHNLWEVSPEYLLLIRQNCKRYVLIYLIYWMLLLIRNNWTWSVWAARVVFRSLISFYSLYSNVLGCLTHLKINLSHQLNQEDPVFQNSRCCHSLRWYWAHQSWPDRHQHSLQMQQVTGPLFHGPKQALHLQLTPDSRDSKPRYTR